MLTFFLISFNIQGSTFKYFFVETLVRKGRIDLSISDIQKLRRFVVGNVDPSEVDKLEKESQIDLLIRAVYGKIECGELETNKAKFDEDFIRFYGYLIIAIHRVLFEQQGKCVKPLLDIANYLDPGDSDFSILLRFYTEIIEKNGMKHERELQNIYQEFKDYFSVDFRALIAPKVIKVVLDYLGVKGLDVNDISFEDESYVHYNNIDVPLEEMIEKFGLVGVGIKNEEILLNYYKTWYYKTKKSSRKPKKGRSPRFSKRRYKNIGARGSRKNPDLMEPEKHQKNGPYS